MTELLMQSLCETSSSKPETSPSCRKSRSYVTSDSYEASSDVRVGAFNVRIFGQSKVADVDVLGILVQVCCRLFLSVLF